MAGVVSDPKVSLKSDGMFSIEEQENIKKKQEKTKIKIAKDEKEHAAKVAARGLVESKRKLVIWSIEIIMGIILGLFEIFSGFKLNSTAVFFILFVSSFIVITIVKSKMPLPEIND